MSAYDAVDGACPAALKCYRLVASKPERFKEVRPGDDDVLTFWRNWQGHNDVMQTRSIRGSGEPAWVIASLNACLRLGPDPRRALWPAVMRTAQVGRTHGCTDLAANVKKTLANGAPSTHGTSCRFAARTSSTAVGGKADMSRTWLDRRD